MNNEERTAYHVAKKRNETKVADQILVSSYARNIEESVAFAHENRVSCHCNCMVGTYGETREESAEGFRRFSNIGNLVGCYVPIFTPFPGTKVWSEVYKSGKLKRTLVGGIDWKLFDAEHGTIDIGYNPRELQRESKLAFYVSERYSKDMREGLERNPWLIDDFLSDISVQMIEYRGNKEIEKIYSELCDVKAKMSEQT